LKKRTKKLLNPGPSLSGKAEAIKAKVFCFFFSKKKSFLDPAGSRPRTGSRPVQPHGAGEQAAAH
jgi:hypothetical protein